MYDVRNEVTLYNSGLAISDNKSGLSQEHITQDDGSCKPYQGIN